MVGTRSRNKDVHPAAPVMSEAAKLKAGIVPTKRRSKKPTKAEEIRELRAKVAALENPDETTPTSKEPLVIHNTFTLLDTKSHRFSVHQRQ